MQAACEAGGYGSGTALGNTPLEPSPRLTGGHHRLTGGRAAYDHQALCVDSGIGLNRLWDPGQIDVEGGAARARHGMGDSYYEPALNFWISDR